MEESEKGLSAGRVQSVAVKIILDRENEISAFVPEEYWTITARLAIKGSAFEAKFTLNGAKKELTNEQEVNEILEAIRDASFKSVK